MGDSVVHRSSRERLRNRDVSPPKLVRRPPSTDLALHTARLGIRSAVTPSACRRRGCRDTHSSQTK